MLKNSIYRNMLGQTDTHLLLTIMSLEITSANSYFFPSGQLKVTIILKSRHIQY